MTQFGACWPMPIEVIDWPRFGLGFVDYAGWCARLGLSVIRMFNVSWRDIEREPGKYDFETCALGNSMRLIQAAGLRVYMNPSRYGDQKNAPDWHYITPSPKAPLPCIDTDAFGRFVVALVDWALQFKDANGDPIVIMWGWGNETDAAYDEIGGLAATAFNGDWNPPAKHQFEQYTLTFARAVRSRVPDATICGPETMTPGYGASMIRSENEFLAVASHDEWPYMRPCTDIVSVHNYAFNGRFPDDNLKRQSGPGDTLETWMKPVLMGRREMIGEWGLEHVNTADRPENPRDIPVYMREVNAMNRFVYAFGHDLDDWLTTGRPQVAKSLVESELYGEVRQTIAEMNARHRGVSK